MKRVRLAVIGTGYWGTKLCHEYSFLSNPANGVSLDYGVDISQEKLDALKARLDNGDMKFCTDYREILQNNRINAVHIAVPNHLHYEVARTSLELGKHVLLEKPMTTSSREALKLARLSEETGLILQVGHIFRFNNALRKVREIMKEGILGKIFYANLAWTAYIAPPKDTDIVFDLAPHPIDILNYLLGEWPVTVNAIGSSYIRREKNREEAAFIHIIFPDRVLANVFVSWIQHGKKERSIVLAGEKAMLKCDAINQTITIWTSEREKQEIEIVPNNTIRDMQLHFIDRIRGRGPQLTSPLVGVTNVQVLEAICYAMKSGSPVNLSFA